MRKESKGKIKAVDFDRAFEERGVTKHLDFQTVKLRRAIQRINIDIPQEILDKVDREAERVGIARTSLIKLWIAERLDRMAG